MAAHYAQVTHISQRQIEKLLVEAGLELGAVVEFDPADSTDAPDQRTLEGEDEKMVALQLYISRFKNRYGEEWQFTYDHAKREGTLRGSDVDWQAYRVLEGRVLGLILNDEEILWLRRAWSEATGGR